MAFFSSERVDSYNYGRKKIEILKEQKDKTLVIHYSCESFFNLKGRTPRVTSIGIKNRGNNTTKAFSIHLQAQIQNKPLDSLSDQDYDILEKSMLEDFYKYVRKHNTHNWVHWNMRNANFGFEAISNRALILKLKPAEIEDQFKFDMPDILGEIYTYGFEIDKPLGKMLNLANRNKISCRDALSGKEEADAFEKHKDYLKLHMSTQRKVEVIDRILSFEETGKLKTNVSIITKYGLSFSGIGQIIANNWLLLLLWSILLYLVEAGLEPVVQRIFHTSQ
jgi:hypothetical protein